MWGRVLQDGVDAHQVVFQLATEGLDLFLAFEMAKDSVAKKKLGIAARHRTAEVREMLQLANHASEGSLATLIWSGYHNDPLLAFQVKTVAHDLRLVFQKLLRKRYVESLLVIHLL